MELDFEKMGGLIPAVAQDATSGVVLMLGYMNEEAFRATQQSGLVTFFSRSRKKLWTKGESSGHSLTVKHWSMDCDGDALLFQVEARGPTCHTGATSCFETSPSSATALSFLTELQAIIQERKTAPPATSYTARLFTEGPKRLAQKIGEEGVETALALAAGSQEELLNEAADLVFHLMVGLESQGLNLEAVAARLKQRHRKEG